MSLSRQPVRMPQIIQPRDSSMQILQYGARPRETVYQREETTSICPLPRRLSSSLSNPRACWRAGLVTSASSTARQQVEMISCHTEYWKPHRYDIHVCWSVRIPPNELSKAARAQKWCYILLSLSPGRTDIELIMSSCA